MFSLYKPVLLFSFLLLFGTFRATAQNSMLDSLKTELARPHLHDTTRLAIITSILQNVRIGDSISTHYNAIVRKIVQRNLAKPQLATEVRNKYYYYLAYWYCDRATELFSVAHSREVIACYDRAIVLFDRAGMDDDKWTAMVNKGNMLRKINAYEAAITCYFTALKHLEANHNELGTAAAYSSLGMVYDDQGNQRQSLFYYLKSIALYDAIKDPIPQDLYESAIILHNIGFGYYKLHQPKKAKPYYERALKISEENGFTTQASYDAQKIGTIFLDERRYDEALQWYEKALQLAGDGRSKANVLNSFGELYYEQGKLSKAAHYYREALAAAKLVEDSPTQEEAYHYLYRILKAQHQPAAALEMYEQYIAFKQASNMEANKNEMAQQQLKYDYEKRALLLKNAQEQKVAGIRLANEKRNARKNTLLYVLISVAVLLLTGLGFLYYYFKQRNRLNASRNNELKQKLLRAQMNPHFIFNSVDNIQSLIYNKQDKEAISYLTKFSKLTRQILEHSRENYILLSEEIAMLENYFTIQQLLYGGKFTFAIDVDETIDTEALLVPPMLTQPFVENAIKHGLRHKQEGGWVRVHYTLHEGELQFEVTDNGSGLLHEEKQQKSLATEITRERLESMLPKHTATVETTDIKDASNAVTGVRTRLGIPYILNT